MKPYRVHIVYEHGDDRRPYSSSHIRLLRPLTHPSLALWLEVSGAPAMCDDPVDLVVIDRLWRSDVTGEHARRLVDEVRRGGARLLYSLDDNLIALLTQSGADEASRGKLAALHAFLTAADRVLVSTWRLCEVVRQFNPRISVIPNYLDERLLPYQTLGTGEEHQRRLAKRRAWLDAPLTLGYMGTRTHADDLRMILPALRSVCRRHAARLRIELVGAVPLDQARSLLSDLPVHWMDPGQLYTEYPSFLPWFVGTCKWDIALAPLADTLFNSFKSDIKFLDYAALGAVGVYSRAPAYERTINHGVTGYLVDNTQDAWESTIEHLVSHPVESLSVGWSAQRHLREHRILAQGSGLWLNAIRLTLAHRE